MPRYNPLANGKRPIRATSSSGLPTVPHEPRKPQPFGTEFRATDADNCNVTQLVGNDAAEANDAPAARRSARIALRNNEK
jgi:hypothetical protein